MNILGAPTPSLVTPILFCLAGDPSRLILAEQLGCGSPPRLILEIDIGQLHRAPRSTQTVLQPSTAAKNGVQPSSGLYAACSTSNQPIKASRNLSRSYCRIGPGLQQRLERVIDQHKRRNAPCSGSFQAQNISHEVVEHASVHPKIWHPTMRRCLQCLRYCSSRDAR